MEFEVLGTCFFQSQVDGLDEKSKRVVKDKLRLLKANPFRYKKVQSGLHSRVYRIRLTVNNKSARLLYAIVDGKVWAIYIDYRDKGYRNLDEYIRKYLSDVL